jgi:hypothetical protein
MAPLTTHLVIGERVFAHLPRLDPSDYGAFLLVGNSTLESFLELLRRLGKTDV